MSTDIFGLTKTSKAAKDVSHPSMVGITIPGGNEVMLCQSVNIDYQRQAQPIYELGSEDVYISVQGASGTVQLSRAINKQAGALAPYQGSGCVEGTSSLKIKAASGGNTKCHADPGVITCEGATLTRVGFQAQAGQAIITDSAEFVIGSLTRGGGGGSGGGSGSGGGNGSDSMQGDMRITDPLTPASQGGQYVNPSMH